MGSPPQRPFYAGRADGSNRSFVRGRPFDRGVDSRARPGEHGRAMSRIPLVETADASPEVQRVYADLQRWGVPLLNVMKLFGNHEAFLRGFYEMFRPLYGTPTISPRHRELAYLRASQLNSCHY
jgi:hypothetical protein